MDDYAFAKATWRLTDEDFEGLYGAWDALSPAEVAAELAGCGVPWWIAGGRAARAGAATTRRHDDTDVTVLERDLDAVRAAMAGWHLWENINGALRPLLPELPVRPECGQLWVRRDAGSPWRMEFLIDRVSTAEEWVFKRDESVRLPWARVTRVIDGIGYLGPEAALLYKAKQDREKDRQDLAAARLTDDGRAWLLETMGKLGYDDWVRLLRRDALPGERFLVGGYPVAVGRGGPAGYLVDGVVDVLLLGQRAALAGKDRRGHGGRHAAGGQFLACLVF